MLFARDKEYIQRSIDDPDAEIVEGYFGGMCPDAGYNTKMKLQRVEAVVEYLTGPETGNKPSPVKEPEE